MNITKIEVAPIEDFTKKLKAYVSVQLDDELQLTGLRIYQGSSGLFVSYPNSLNLEVYDLKQLFYPMTMEFREKVELAVLAKYKKVLEETVMDKGGPILNLHGKYADVAKEMLEKGDTLC